jgi:hypothetical protein
MTRCKYLDCGWCYAPDDVKTNAHIVSKVCHDPNNCPYLKSQMTETDISKVLIEGDTVTIMGVKYKRVEEPKTPAEEAYKRVYGWYPPTTSSVSNYEDNRWSAFQDGYDAAFFEGCKVEEEPKPKLEFLCNVMRNLGYPIEYCDEIVDAVEKWLPDELPDDNGVYNGVYELGWNDAIKALKDKLR